MRRLESQQAESLFVLQLEATNAELGDKTHNSQRLSAPYRVSAATNLHGSTCLSPVNEAKNPREVYQISI